jgi:hypothetical protein
MLFLNRKHSAQGTNHPPISSVNPEGFEWLNDRYDPVRVEEIASDAGRRTCANPQCISAWRAPWRSRKRPIFEEKWACSGRCILELVCAAMRRESSHGGAIEPMRHRHRVPLGLLMLEEGWINQSQLRRALEIQRERGGRIGEIFVQECGVASETITRGLAKQWSCPILASGEFSPQAMSLVAPKIFIERSNLIPLRAAGSRLLYAGFEDHPDASAALALERMTGLKVESGLMPLGEYSAVRSALLEQPSIRVKEESSSTVDALAARITAILEQTQPMASRLVRFYRHYWLRLWLESPVALPPRSAEDMLDYVFTVAHM